MYINRTNIIIRSILVVISLNWCYNCESYIKLNIKKNITAPIKDNFSKVDCTNAKVFKPSSSKESISLCKSGIAENGDTIFFDDQKGYDEIYSFYYNEMIPGPVRTGINQQLPYGPKELMNNIFSKDYFHHVKNDFYDTTRIISDLYKICRFYFKNIEDTISTYWGGDSDGTGSIRLPKIRSAQIYPFENSDNSFFQYLDTQSPLEILEKIIRLHVVYRFPDIQNCEIYLSSKGANYGSYSYLPFYTDKKKEGYLFDINELVAYFIIVNKKSNHAKIIPAIAFEKYDNFDFSFRFFYITADKKILVYEMETKRKKDWEINKYIDEYDIRLRMTNIMTINTNNEIVIESLIEDR